MMRAVLVLVPGALPGCRPAGAAPPPDDTVARVAWVTGTVRLHRAGQQRPEDAVQGNALHRGDRIVRGPVELTVGPAGQVTVARIKDSTVKSPAFEPCLVGAASRSRFPAPSGGGVVVFTYPVVFQP